MNFEEQVTNSELSKRLKELLVKQDSLFYWVPGSLVRDEYEGGYDINNDQVWSIWTTLKKPEYYDFMIDWDNELTEEENFKKIKETKNKLTEQVCSAFTVAELGEMFPNEKTISCWSQKTCCVEPEKLWGCTYYTGSFDNAITEYAKTEADARAKMLICLIEKELINLQNIDHKSMT
jgi:hypothetical protein